MNTETLSESLVKDKNNGENPMTVVGLLGTIHNEQLRQKYNCSLELYKNLILEFNPDIICGEVHPISWSKYLNDKSEKGYWGEPASEYWELIFPLCEENNIRFVPIDWFELDVWNDFDPFSRFTEDRKLELQRSDDEWFSKQMKTYVFGKIPFNSIQFDTITRQKYEWLSHLNERAHNFRWVIRNQIMIQRVRNTYKSNPESRILCIVGADHNYYFKEELQEEPITFIYPIR